MITSLLLAATLASPADALLHHPKLTPHLRSTLRMPHEDARAERLVMVRFTRALDDGELRELERVGLRFESRGFGRYLGVRGPGDALARLLDDERVERILPPAPPMRVLPTPLASEFDTVDNQTRAFSTWVRRDVEGRRLTGEGVVIADMDSGIDVFHPQFFFADAGRYDWIDVDDDGELTTGVDAVDLDGDGEVDPEELLRSFGGNVVDHAGDVIDFAIGYEVGRSYLYADTDGDFTRDIGRAEGYDDSTPGFGEPLFIADDVDQNGRVDIGERLLRLGTSKIRAVIREYSGETFTRGQNLIDLVVHEQSGHGTGVAGILAGGVYGQTQLSGVAPDAELVMIDQAWLDGDAWEPVITQAAAAASARDLGADILVHEYGSHIHTYGDGSDAWEEFIDELSLDGMVQVTATHNFAAPGSTARVSVGAGAAETIPMEIYTGGFYPNYGVYMTIRWRDGELGDVTGTLHTPDGLAVPMSTTGSTGDTWAYAEPSTSPRGTHMLAVSVLRWDGVDYIPLSDGAYGIELYNASGAPIEVQVMIGDDTAYAYFAQLTAHLDASTTMAFPSTADRAISVGACAGNQTEPGEEVGALKDFSGRGPRIDGEQGVDVVAPEDDYTPAPSSLGGEGDLFLFGGTSGALPQVAGAIALLLQAEPDLTPARIKDRVHQSAAEDQLTGITPNNRWGAGRLDVHRLLTGEDVGDDTRPTVELTLPDEIFAGIEVQLDASGSSAAGYAPDDLSHRWDFGYDGELDETGAIITRTFDEVGSVRLALEVETPLGWSTRALYTLQVLEAPEEPDPNGPNGPNNPNDPNGPGDVDPGQPGGGCAGVQPGVWLLGLGLLGLRRRRSAV